MYNKNHQSDEAKYPQYPDVSKHKEELNQIEVDEMLQKALARGEGAVAFVHFDALAAKSNIVDALVHYKDLPYIDRGLYVSIESGIPRDDGSLDDAKQYTGRIIEGPFYNPVALKRDSTPIQFIILNQSHGKALALPEYHALVRVEILGEQIEGSLIGATSRPRPASPVKPFNTNMMASMFNLRGNMILGHLDGYKDVLLRIDEADKGVVPRNWLTVGTIGSGKSNTNQVFIEETLRAKYAQIVIDPEGEYILMDEVSTQKGIDSELELHGRKREGVSKMLVYYPVGAASDRENAKPFSVSFDSLPPEMIAELTEMNSTQRMRFTFLYQQAIAYLKRKTPRKTDDVLGDDINYVAQGHPGITLALLLNILEQEITYYDNKTASIKKKKLSPEEEREQKRAALSQIPSNKDAKESTQKLYFEQVKLNPLFSDAQDRQSYAALARKLRELQMTDLFDGENILSAQELSEPGCLTVIDMSDADSQQIVNIVIADLLSKMYHYKMKLSEEVNKQRKVFITIEEAHGFISRENKDKMEETLEQLRRIARRGRKRWLALHFVTQSPEHLPSELFELANNKIIHQTTGTQNLRVLKSAAGSVNDAIWDEVPTLGRGRAVMVSSQFPHPLIIGIRPATSRRYYIE